MHKRITALLLCLSIFLTGILFAYAETPEASSEAEPTPTAVVTPAPAPTPSGSSKSSSDVKAEVKVGEDILYISEKPEDVDIPDGYVESEFFYKDYLVKAYYNKRVNMKLLYLVSQDYEKTGFYAFDETTDIFSKYVSVEASTQNYIIIEKPADEPSPEGYLERTVTMDGTEVTVWLNEIYNYLSPEESEYFIVYAMNPDGEKGFYVYDRIESTFQRYDLPGYINIDPFKNKTPGPDNVLNPDDIEEGDMWSKAWDSITAYFNRLFGGEAETGDWVVLALIGLIVVLLSIIVVFIIYAKRKVEEEKSEEVPLDGKKEKKRYRRSQLYSAGHQQPAHQPTAHQPPVPPAPPVNKGQKNA